MAIALHEYAHCWTADKLGDPTPRIKGRLTLDPRAHLDPLGVVAILFTRFGWGKPAPYDPYNLRDPVRDTALIAVSGTILNLIIAVILGIIIRIIPVLPGVIRLSLIQILVINIFLGLFNLIPVKPLDGSKVLAALLPPDIAAEYNRFMDQFGIMILILMLIPFGGGQSPIAALIVPAAEFITRILLG